MNVDGLLDVNLDYILSDKVFYFFRNILEKENPKEDFADRNTKIFIFKYFLGYTFRELSDILKLSPARIQQILYKHQRILKRRFGDKLEGILDNIKYENNPV